MRKESIALKKESTKEPLREFVLEQSHNGTFKILHKPFRREFFRNLSADIASEMFVRLQRMTRGWNGKGNLPQDFQKAVLLIYKDSHEELGIPMSSHIGPTKGKGKQRKIKRRKKKVRQIKRRKSSAKTITK